jgi:hypothetical protein
MIHCFWSASTALNTKASSLWCATKSRVTLLQRSNGRYHNIGLSFVAIPKNRILCDAGSYPKQFLEVWRRTALHLSCLPVFDKAIDAGTAKECQTICNHRTLPNDGTLLPPASRTNTDTCSKGFYGYSADHLQLLKHLCCLPVFVEAIDAGIAKTGQTSCYERATVKVWYALCRLFLNILRVSVRKTS